MRTTGRYDNNYVYITLILSLKLTPYALSLKRSFTKQNEELCSLSITFPDLHLMYPISPKKPNIPEKPA
jgi:hypothetical protein